MIQSLYPIPGSKAARKYDRYLYPSLTATTISEPFAGAATKSIRYYWLESYLGEIDPGRRAISLALNDPQSYVDGYKKAKDRFWGDLARRADTVLRYAGIKNSQTNLKADLPDIYEQLTEQWKAVARDVHHWMYSGHHEPKLSGYYAFCIRACFGNVMRLTPAGTHFNVSWHVDKLKNACEYDPQGWIADLQNINWNPNVYSCWQEAISAVPDPSKCYLLLDPPYWVDGQVSKMTPCYSSHSIGTKGGHDETFNLAVDSLAAGLDRGFPEIDVCNYYSPQLHSAISEMVSDAGYSLSTNILGECNALGNSNGRRKHGQRVDKRKRPVEVIYRVSRVPINQTVPMIETTEKQLSLIG